MEEQEEQEVELLLQARLLKGELVEILQAQVHRHLELLEDLEQMERLPMLEPLQSVETEVLLILELVEEVEQQQREDQLELTV
jgi:hypothetical protein